jgi:hypothetical protein
VGAGPGVGVTARRLGFALLCLWLLRWAARELAAYAGRHWRKHGPPPIESDRAPGWMPPPTRSHARETRSRSSEPDVSQ